MTKLVRATKRKASGLSLTGEQHVMQAGMPQLVPFYFVNETTFAWILFPTLIYVLTKYLLPQQVRKMAGRLFITKL
jgi:F-type H+-transporting ATPase subunit 8